MSREEATAAIGFLIQYALTQLLLAGRIGTGSPEARRTAMFAGLYAITGALRRYQGSRNDGFDRAWHALESGAFVHDAPGLAGRLSRANQPARDHKLFLTMRNLARNHTRIDLTPYFYTVDAEERAYGFG